MENKSKRALKDSKKSKNVDPIDDLAENESKL